VEHDNVLLHARTTHALKQRTITARPFVMSPTLENHLDHKLFTTGKYKQEVKGKTHEEKLLSRISTTSAQRLFPGSDTGSRQMIG
jgi:hypothetical protein